MSWIKLGEDIYGEAAGDQSGLSVSLTAEGSRVAIAAPNNDGSCNSLNNSGHVRVYELSGNNRVQLGQYIDGEATRDSNGYSVSLSAD